MSRSRSLFIAMITVGSTCLVYPGPSTAAEPPPDFLTAEAKARFVAQEPLLKPAHALRAVAEKFPDGYAGISVADGFVRLYWKGAQPLAVQGALTDARRTVPVKVEPTPYSLAQLRAEKARLMAQIERSRDPAVHGVDIPDGAAGIVVYTDGKLDRSRQTALTALRPALAVPVRFEYGPRMAPAVGRMRDERPNYLGGARIFSLDTSQYNPNGWECTSGWGVHNGGIEYLITAAHCGRVGQQWTNGCRYQTIGAVTHERQDHDLMLIRTDAGGAMYHGPAVHSCDPAAQNPMIKNVKGWHQAMPGTGICQSGSFSGTFCTHDIRGQGDYSAAGVDPYGTTVWVHDMFRAWPRSGRTEVIGGDSGGPVLAVHAEDNFRRVAALGIISGKALDGSFYFFQDFATAHQDWPVLNTITAP